MSKMLDFKKWPCRGKPYPRPKVKKGDIIAVWRGTKITKEEVLAVYDSVLVTTNLTRVRWYRDEGLWMERSYVTKDGLLAA